MSVLSLNADNIFPKVIRIGYEGENVVTQIDFNLKMWVAEYGLGGVTLLVLRHGDANAYPVALMIEDGIASWTITKTDTAKVGRGAIQLKYVVGEKIKKSPVFDISCLNALDDSDTVPDPYDSWLATLTDLSALTTANAQAAAQSESNAQASAELAEQSASAASESASASAESAQSAAQSASQASESASRAKVSEQAAQSALAGMTFVSFTVDEDGHVLITNSDLLGTTAFELTESGHMEVTY